MKTHCSMLPQHISNYLHAEANIQIGRSSKKQDAAYKLAKEREWDCYKSSAVSTMGCSLHSALWHGMNGKMSQRQTLSSE